MATRTINYSIKPYNPIGTEELEAAQRVIKSGVLSDFVGSHGSHFYGGVEVRKFEKDIQEFYGVKHAITVNSWTSGLTCAIGAIDPEPFSEIIVPTWTMCASATAVLHWNCIPVFADIDPETFCISPSSIESLISDKTIAILAVDIAGHPCDYRSIRRIASKHNLRVISDSAQSPYSYYDGSLLGSQCDIGGFSYNYHKHIHTGEGGVVVTNDDQLAMRARLIRNHGEACVSGMNYKDISSIIGYNYRMGEIEAAIGQEQLLKLPRLVQEKIDIANILLSGLSHLPGLKLPSISAGCTHSFYVFCMQVDPDLVGCTRDDVFNALQKEGVPGLMNSFANLHLLPMYQNKIAYGSGGFPWVLPDGSSSSINYDRGICPIAEEMQSRTFLGLQLCTHELTPNIADDIVTAFQKTWNSL